MGLEEVMNAQPQNFMFHQPHANEFHTRATASANGMPVKGTKKPFSPHPVQPKQYSLEEAAGLQPDVLNPRTPGVKLDHGLIKKVSKALKDQSTASNPLHPLL